jgi:predicted RNA methylase
MPETGNNSSRSMLSNMRKALKDENTIQEVLNGIKIRDLYKHLDSDDAKTRKNAALLIGELQKILKEGSNDMETEPEILREETLDIGSGPDQLLSHYIKEETLFVRPAYLEALSEYDIKNRNDIVDILEQEEKKLSSEKFEENEVKHKSAELHDLKLLLLQNGKKTRHEFNDFIHPFEVLLTCDDSVKAEVAELTYSECKIVKSGVRTRVSDYRNLQKIRMYKEALFLIPMKKGYVPNADNLGQLAEKTAVLKLVDDLFNNTKDQDDGADSKTGTKDIDEADTYRFRLESRSEDPELGSGDYLRKIATLIERGSNGRLVNDPGDYEFTVVFRDGKNNNLSLYILLPGNVDRRFTYRKNSEPTSMNPVTAAAAISLIKSYMSEDAQMIDPLCGTGTLMIERALALPAREYYGTDTYGQAVKEARENAMYAGVYNMNFINRNFFDFQHDYPFQEILTEFPDMFGKEDVEKNNFCRMFFEKAIEISDDEAMMFIISGEESLIKKHIRISGVMKLVRTINLKKYINIYVIKIRKTGND